MVYDDGYPTCVFLVLQVGSGKTTNIRFLLVKGFIFTCGEARRSMDDNYSPYNILEMMAYRGHKDMGT